MAKAWGIGFRGLGFKLAMPLRAMWSLGFIWEWCAGEFRRKGVKWLTGHIKGQCDFAESCRLLKHVGLTGSCRSSNYSDSGFRIYATCGFCRPWVGSKCSKEA